MPMIHSLVFLSPYNKWMQSTLGIIFKSLSSLFHLSNTYTIQLVVFCCKLSCYVWLPWMYRIASTSWKFSTPQDLTSHWLRTSGSMGLNRLDKKMSRGGGWHGHSQWPNNIYIIYSVTCCLVMILLYERNRIPGFYKRLIIMNARYSFTRIHDKYRSWWQTTNEKWEQMMTALKLETN